MNSNLLTINDFNVICRICLMTKENMLYLTNEEFHMLDECTLKQETFPTDKFPQQMCTDCSTQLRNSYQFKQKCVLSVKILYEVLSRKDQSNDIIVKPEPNTICSESNSDHNSIKLETDQVETSVIIKDEDVNFDGNDDLVEVEDDKNSMHNSEDEEMDQEKIELAKCKIELLSNTSCELLDLTCDICNRNFRHRSKLLKHIKTHLKDKKYSHFCKLCDQGFYWISSLDRHMVRHSTGPNFKCELCSKDFFELPAFALHHRKVHNSKPVKCQECSRKFLHPLQLERHQQRGHGVKEHICDVCGEKFSQNSQLKRHRMSHTNDQPYACTYCDKKYKQKSALKKHVLTEHTNTVQETLALCFMCGKSVNDLRMHLLSHEQTSDHKCSICLKTYKTKYKLNSHVKTRHPSDGIIKKYYCKICNKSVIERSNLAKHMAAAHITVKRHECSYCGKMYKLKSHVNQHVRSVHLEERSHICTICKKGFFSKHILEDHMITHTGERPHTCNVCGKTFGRKNHLYVHSKSHST